MFKDKVLLITGGTGSFGNTVVKSFIDKGLKEIRILSRDEKKQDDMRKKYNNPKLKFYVGDVRDEKRVKEVMTGVDYVFHAAALKQVPSCEFYPLEAVKTNIIGTDNVLNAAIECNVKKVICLSTDKAVYPINAMGMSKAMMEKIFVSRARLLNENQTVLCGTRYGNVMASRGSVIPLFVEQIKASQPITITDPKMTRFLMSLEEAVKLVLFAFEYGNNGDLFVQKAPACTVEVLAQALQELFGVENEVKVIGTRHGEKLYETLVSSEEKLVSEDLGDYYRIPCDHRDLNYGSGGSSDKILHQQEAYTSHNTTQLSVEEVKEKLLTLPYIQEELKNIGRVKP
ncbi:polysaccharide biosynthesis protein [Turicibacter bilis]|uniref:SDR family NAD(P)-dependent oxidoreductase n=1 Tax=Turicibacter bilis TaxID=2735723 RepID=UPI0006C54C83|nr:SDR family NAD(P)-dependent oxidoreductase [Turicibacter bilis]MBS3201899.1 polysaccharide biosynthesis protein [Turicibacter bilis]UUF10518.1 polysaccharide biosynthesis protein [Turicibacter bilis]CUO12017.1 UDP-glucose 4-epimerase [Turicibacter sanguinis]